MAEKPYGKEPLVPAIPDIRTNNLQDVLRAIKEWIDVRQGKRGEMLDRAVTLRDLLNAGIAEPGSIRGLYEGDFGEGIPLLPPTGDDSPIPPTPTNLTATSTLKRILLSWEFARGYTRLAYFEVWRSTTDALGDAQLIGQTYAPMYSDPVEPETTYYYWVRAVSDAGHSNFNAISGTHGETPFFLQGDETEVNGEPVHPRMYIKDGYIMNGTITRAKIGDLAVDDAKIYSMSVDKLIAGKLQIGEYIESYNYSSGATGFIIHGNGNAEFNNVTVRGTVYANAGVIGGVNIKNYGLETTTYNGTTAGWQINAAGDVHFTNGTFRGTVYALDGVFAGSLSAATGTFAGSLSAATGTFTGRVHGGYFTTGNFTGYAWPSSGGGSYLGPGGLLLGNANTGQWFQVTDAGAISAPGFSVSGGTLTITAANVIDTLQLRGNAVSAVVAGGTSFSINTGPDGASVFLIYSKAVSSTADVNTPEYITSEATVGGISAISAQVKIVTYVIGTEGDDLVGYRNQVIPGFASGWLQGGTYTVSFSGGQAIAIISKR